MANIGIIVYSQTGNTMAVAQRLQGQLREDGHTVTIDQVLSTDPSGGPVKLTVSPSVGDYDTLVFASPVQAFSLARAMLLYLQQLPTLQEKTVACLLTKHLPFNWTGGNRALRQMAHLCQAKGALLRGSAIVHWRPEKRDQEIREAVERLSGLF